MEGDWYSEMGVDHIDESLAKALANVAQADLVAYFVGKGMVTKVLLNSFFKMTGTQGMDCGFMIPFDERWGGRRRLGMTI